MSLNSYVNALFIGNINPFRYRGYYYDNETGFYYLQTRYYDPTICRFINADNYELVAELSQTVGQLNLYAYCNNNPIMYTDKTGEFFWGLAIVGAIIGAGFGAISAYNNDENVGAAIAIGAVVGFFSAGFGWSPLASAVANVVGSVVNDIVNENDVYLDKALYVGATSLVLGYGSNKIFQYIPTNDKWSQWVGYYILGTVFSGTEMGVQFGAPNRLSLKSLFS